MPDAAAPTATSDTSRRGGPAEPVGAALQAIKAQIREQAARLGYDLDAPLPPEPEPSCRTCRDAHWLRVEVPEDDPRWPSAAMPCPTCFDYAEAAGLRSEPQRLQTFDAFKPVPGAKEAFSAARAYARDPRGWLAICGEPGSGKTHLGLAIVNAMVERRQWCKWWYAPDLLAVARDAYLAQRLVERGTVEQALDDPRVVRLADLRTELQRPHLIVIDDLGAARSTPFAISDLFEPLMDWRYRHRLPTVITMLGTPSEVKEGFSESIGRRLEDSEVSHVVWNDAPQYHPKGGNHHA